MTDVIVPPAFAAVPALGVSGGEDLSWQERGLCTQMDPEAFFPEKGGSTREAKKVCRGCEVRVECLEYALEHDERFGIWGGLSERERRRMRRVDFTATGPALAPAPSDQAPAEGVDPGSAQQAASSPAASCPAPDAAGPACEPELVAACRQRDLNPADRAMAMGALARKGHDQARICARTGLSAATVRKHMALLDLDEASLGRVRSGQLSLDRAAAAVLDARLLTRRPQGRASAALLRSAS